MLFNDSPLAGRRDKQKHASKSVQTRAHFFVPFEGTRRASWFRGGLLSFFLGRARKNKER